MTLSTELLAMITDRLSPGGSPGGVEDAAQVWERLFTKFRPLIGPLSTSLLFTRVLFLHSRDFPWLGELPGLRVPQDAHKTFGAFVQRLHEQPPEDVVAVNRTLVAAYGDALADLIGERLTSRFLHAAFAPGDAHKNT